MRVLVLMILFFNSIFLFTETPENSFPAPALALPQVKVPYEIAAANTAVPVKTDHSTSSCESPGSLNNGHIALTKPTASRAQINDESKGLKDINKLNSKPQQKADESIMPMKKPEDVSSHHVKKPKKLSDVSEYLASNVEPVISSHKNQQNPQELSSHVTATFAVDCRSIDAGETCEAEHEMNVDTQEKDKSVRHNLADEDAPSSKDRKSSSLEMEEQDNPWEQPSSPSVIPVTAGN